MTDVSSQKPPVLDPPGAGLPWLELRIARLMFRWLRSRTTREQATARFASNRDMILSLARRCDPEAGCERVLISRLRGLEDSSRFWSVFMTVDHLHIVNGAIAEVLDQLGQGRIPPRPSSTADVKPRVDVDSRVLAEFEGSCGDFERSASAIPDLKTVHRHAHPWFGPLDAAGWHFMAAFHMGLHHRQMIEILRQLPDHGRAKAVVA